MVQRFCSNPRPLLLKKIKQNPSPTLLYSIPPAGLGGVVTGSRSGGEEIYSDPGLSADRLSMQSCTPMRFGGWAPYDGQKFLPH